jgi:hypothetical protein
MRSTILVAAIAGLALAPEVRGAPAVEINFVQPDRYTDASPDGFKSQRDASLAQLKEYFRGLGAEFLGDEDRLTIWILDVDLAGHLEPFRGNSQQVRIRRDGGVPSIHLRYTLTRASVDSSAEERIADLSYLKDARRCQNGEALCYEKHMLSEWFARRFGGTAPSAR